MKQGSIEEKHPVFPLSRYLASVYVDDVGQKLEGVEGNTYGKGNGRNGKGQAKQRFDVGQEEARVLEHGQKPQADYQSKDQPQAAMSPYTVNETGAEIAHERHARQEKHQSRASPCVKY